MLHSRLLVRAYVCVLWSGLFMRLVQCADRALVPLLVTLTPIENHTPSSKSGSGSGNNSDSSSSSASSSSMSNNSLATVTFGFSSRRRS